MDEMIRLTDNRGYSVELPKGSTLDAARQALPPFRWHPVAALVNGALQEMDYPLHVNSEVRWLDLNTNSGWRIYRRSLIFLLDAAVSELYPERRLWVSHSLDAGVFCRLENGPDITREEVARLADHVRELIDADLPLTRERWSKADAITYFREHGDDDKADLVEGRPVDYLYMYCLHDFKDYHFGRMAIRTGLLERFSLHAFDGGFVLRLPARTYLGMREKDRINVTQLHATLREYDDWTQLLGIRTVTALNKVVRSGASAFNELILVAETLYERRLEEISDYVASHLPEKQVLLLAGPSSSGKTTTLKRLGIQFRTLGVKPLLISMDDYYLDRDQTPRNERGFLDFENPNAINLPLFQQHMEALLRGEEVGLPAYDFINGVSLPDQRRIRLDDRSVLMVEGLHALNGLVSDRLPRERLVKIFLSALTQLNMDHASTISTADNRLLRRIARDMNFRGIEPSDNLARWDEVRRGEQHYIFPYQEEADFFINSELIYELPILRTLVEAPLAAIGPDDPSYLEARRLLRFLSYIEPALPENVPRNSILQEFIGNSIFAV